MVARQGPRHVALAAIDANPFARSFDLRQACVGPHPEITVLVFQHGVRLHRTAGSEGRGDAQPEPLGPPARRIEPIDSQTRGHPQRSTVPFGHGQHSVVAERCAVGLVVLEPTHLSGYDVDFHESRGARRDPQVAGVIEMQSANLLLGRHGRLPRRRAQRHEASRHRVAPGDPAAVGADPEPAVGAARECGNPVVREAPGHAALADQVPQCVAVVADQPVLGTEPEKSLAVLHDRHHAALRQAGIGAEVREVHGLRGLNSAREAEARRHDRDGGRCRAAGGPGARRAAVRRLPHGVALP